MFLHIILLPLYSEGGKQQVNFENSLLSERSRTQKVIYDSIYMKRPDQANPRDRKEIGESQGQWGEEMGSKTLWE